jgi:hypothetical protein
MPIEIQVSDQAVTIALITGGTTVAVTCIKAAAEVATACIQTLRPRPPRQGRSSRHPIPKGRSARGRAVVHTAPSCAPPWSLPALRTSGTLTSGGKLSTTCCVRSA